jgi:hypothetical protein
VLKFFRKYNVYILGIGGSLLMIVFLIQPVMSMFTPDPMAQARGTFDGGEITQGELSSANGQLAVLGRFGLILDRDPDEQSNSGDALRWALILKDAQRLGLSASDYEVKDLCEKLGQSPADIEKFADRMRATPGAIYGSIKDWLIVQQYKELAAGQSHMPAVQRALLMRTMLQDPNSYLYYEALSYGSTRLSKPLVEHFLQDQGSLVSGQLVMVRADQFLESAPEPTQEQIDALFEAHKDDLPGRGEPYGFGYRIPDRVKIEYLTISMDQARQAVKATEADALAYYRQHKERYTEGGVAEDAVAGDAKPKPYDQVRDQVIQELSEERAFELVDKMAKDAYGMLYEDTRGMAKQGDYRVVADASLTPLREVADRLEADFGLLPQVRSETQGWVNADELIRLPGLGQSVLGSNVRVDFTSYVLSARELEPETDNPLLPHRLQVGLAGSPMITFDGARHIFRIRDAEPSRQPKSVDSVREQVQKDAKRLNAYKELVSSQDTWRERAVAEGLQAVAAQADAKVTQLPPTARRERQRSGLLTVPSLPGVGQSEAFVKAYFGTADTAQQDGGTLNAPKQEILGVVAVDRQLALAVYEVDDYQPLTREQFLTDARHPMLPIEIDLTILAQARAQSPLSLKSLRQRLNYDDGRDEEEN